MEKRNLLSSSITVSKLKFLIYFCAIGYLVILLVVMYLLRSVALSALDVSIKAADSADSAEVIYNQFKLNWTILITSVVIFGGSTIALIIQFANKTLGPLVPIQKQLEQYVSGNFTPRITLRKTDLDNYKEIANHLNQLGEKLSSQ